MSLSQKGFTLTELLVIVGIFATIVAIAIPNISSMMKTAQFKEAARGIATSLQNARSSAVAENLEYRVAFDVANNRYQVERGYSSSGSAWPGTSKGWITFQPGVTMAGTLACTNTNQEIQFNPNGTANQLYICVMDGGTVKFKVGVTSSATGRVAITTP